MTVFCVINEIKEDINGYTTYVFQLLDPEEIELFKFKYITCTKVPNWESEELSIGLKGYLNYQEHKAGIDTWYNGTEQVPYRYSFIQFIQFVEFNLENHVYQL